MTRILALIVLVAALAVGGWYFFLRGGDSAGGAVAAWVEGIGAAEGGLDLGDGSTITAASMGETGVDLTVTYTGDADTTSSLFMISQESAVSAVVCANESLKAALEGGTAFNVTAVAADGTELGTTRVGRAVCG